MPADPVIVTELVRLYTDDLPGLEALRTQVIEAYTARKAVNIHLNSRSRESSSSAGIMLSTTGEQRDFLAACQEATARINGDNPTASSLASTMHFGMSPVQV